MQIYLTYIFYQPNHRRLCDMLQENDEVISFYPGCRKNGQTLLGRIIIHDRARVESEVLPKYFNHASFASLRRQLNYFSFTRIGKGRQRGATYCNDAVIELGDILRLKRRAVGTTAVAPDSSCITSETQFQDSSSSNHSDSSSCEDNDNNFHSRMKTSGKRPSQINDDSNVSNLRQLKSESTFRPIKRSRYNRPPKKEFPQVISPLSTSPVHQSEEEIAEPEESHVFLDLTVPSKRAPSLREYRHTAEPRIHTIENIRGDDDILEGCNALLSLSSIACQAQFA